MVGSQSHGHMVLKLCCQADLQMEMYYLTWAPSWALHQALVNQTGRPDKAIDNYYKIRWETVSRKNTPSKNPSSWREDKLLQLTDSIQNIYQVSQHLKKEGKLFWQVLKTSASWSFDFIPLYYVKGKLQCIYTLAGYQVAHTTRVWVSAFTLNSWTEERKSYQEQWPPNWILQLHTETLLSKKLITETAEQAGAMRATEMIHLGAMCELVDHPQGFRILVQLLTEYSSGDNMPLCPVLYKPLKKMPLLWGTVPHNCEVLRVVKRATNRPPHIKWSANHQCLVGLHYS